MNELVTWKKVLKYVKQSDLMSDCDKKIVVIYNLYKYLL